MLHRCAAFVAAAGVVVVSGCAQTDAGVTTNVKTKLAADDLVKAYQVEVETRNRVVTLSGEVQSAAAKAQALRIARETDGVRDVIDQIRIDEAAATAGRAEDAGREAADRTTAALSDGAITSAVKAKLLADTAVKGLTIDVDTEAGAVTLSGTVSSRAEADRALMLARNTEGVVRVVDNLTVGRY